MHEQAHQGTCSHLGEVGNVKQLRTGTDLEDRPDIDKTWQYSYPRHAREEVEVGMRRYRKCKRSGTLRVHAEV